MPAVIDPTPIPVVSTGEFEMVTGPTVFDLAGPDPQRGTGEFEFTGSTNDGDGEAGGVTHSAPWHAAEADPEFPMPAVAEQTSHFGEAQAAARAAAAAKEVKSGQVSDKQVKPSEPATKTPAKPRGTAKKA